MLLIHPAQGILPNTVFQNHLIVFCPVSGNDPRRGRDNDINGRRNYKLQIITQLSSTQFFILRKITTLMFSFQSSSLFNLTSCTE